MVYTIWQLAQPCNKLLAYGATVAPPGCAVRNGVPGRLSPITAAAMPVEAANASAHPWKSDMRLDIGLRVKYIHDPIR